VHQADARDFDFGELARAGPLRVVGNLPYNVSTPLLFHLFGFGQAIRDMYFMLQREVVDRMVATPGRSAYGRLSVMTAYHCRARMLFSVGAGAFRPPPRVTSAVVHLEIHTAPPVALREPATFGRLVAHLFSLRRKTLRNGLRGRLDESQIAALGIDPGARAETLDLAGFAALANAAADASDPPRGCG
jgi:16S rRNA (adenine1518-N6/adenine1519-N6)-dimethyltransferase